MAVNQQVKPGQWNLLGTFAFGASATVALTDQANGTVIADAIKVVPTPGQGGTGGTPALHYVYPDHLGTPRLIANAANQPVWRWDNVEPFGDTPPQENPSGLGAFEFPLRFPGQYQDRETGLSYNYFRDYDPQTGRYVQSDPVGLVGGLNTYAYVETAPIYLEDRFGLLGSFLYANMRGMTLNDSVQIGGMGNAALAAGVVPTGMIAAGLAAAPVVCEIPIAVGTGVIKAAISPRPYSIWSRILGLLKPLPPNSALPPPVPPSTPAIIRQVPQLKPPPPPKVTDLLAIGAGGVASRETKCSPRVCN